LHSLVEHLVDSLKKMAELVSESPALVDEHLLVLQELCLVELRPALLRDALNEGLESHYLAGVREVLLQAANVADQTALWTVRQQTDVVQKLQVIRAFLEGKSYQSSRILHQL